MSYKSGETPTGIHTRISDTVRISSAWRSYGNENFSTMAWETFLWDGDKIIEDYTTFQNADNVVNLHLEILNNYKKGETK